MPAKEKKKPTKTKGKGKPEKGKKDPKKKKGKKTAEEMAKKSDPKKANKGKGKEITFFDAEKPALTSTGKKKYSLFDSSAMDSRLGGLGGKKIDFSAIEKQQREDGFAAPKDTEKRSKIWMALNPERLHKMSEKEKKALHSDENVMVMEVRGGGGMGALAAEDMMVARDEKGEIITEYEEEEESDFEEGDLADFDPETMDELTKKRMERAKAEEERRKQLRKRSQAIKAEEQQKIEKQLKEIEKQKAAEEKAHGISSKDIKATQDKLSNLEFGGFGFGFDDDE